MHTSSSHANFAVYLWFLLRKKYNERVIKIVINNMCPDVDWVGIIRVVVALSLDNSLD